MTNITEKFSYDYVIRLGALVVALVLAGAVGWFGYRWYTQRRDYAAYSDFVQYQEKYKKLVGASTGKPTAEQLQAIAQSFTAGAEQHKHSALAPFFLAYRAEIAEQQNKPAETIEYLGKALSSMPKNSPLYEYYGLKQALLKLDQAQEQLPKEGMQELAQLAQSTDAGIRDMALYYKGLYEYAHNNIAQARESWNLLLSKAKPDSHWRTLAQEKLA
jgi:predicted negative regulator of RcsB-dependent stress response